MQINLPYKININKAVCKIEIKFLDTFRFAWLLFPLSVSVNGRNYWVKATIICQRKAKLHLPQPIQRDLTARSVPNSWLQGPLIFDTIIVIVVIKERFSLIGVGIHSMD